MNTVGPTNVFTFSKNKVDKTNTLANKSSTTMEKKQTTQTDRPWTSHTKSLTIGQAAEITLDFNSTKGKTDKDQSLERQAKEIIARKRVTMPTKTFTTDSEAKKLIRQKDQNQIRAPRKETVVVDRKNIRL